VLEGQIVELDSPKRSFEKYARHRWASRTALVRVSRGPGRAPSAGPVWPLPAPENALPVAGGTVRCTPHQSSRNSSRAEHRV